MGLDITYARGWMLEDDLSDGVLDVDSFDARNIMTLYNYKCFHERARDFEVRLTRGECVYYGAFYPYGKRGHTPIGSYTYYSWWRTLISREFLGVTLKMTNAQAQSFSDKPFYELIDFADNEGTIGATAAKELSCDFRLLGTELQALAKSLRSSIERDNFMETCKEFERAFTVAASGSEGAVRFH